MPRIRAASHHPQLHPARIADHVLIPRRIPDELDVGLVHAFDGQNFALGIMRDCRAHPTAGRGQRHFHFNARAPIILLRQFAIVNQTKVYNIDRDFRVVALLKLIPNILFRNFAVTGRSFSWRCFAWLQPQRVYIFF